MYNSIRDEQIEASKQVTYTQEQLDRMLEEARLESQMITEARFKNLIQLQFHNLHPIQNIKLQLTQVITSIE